MDTNKMREMREAFERTNSRDHRRQPPKGNNYLDPMAQADWESFQKGWQTSREALVVELPPAPEAPEDPEDAIDDSHMDAYHSAIGMRHACAQFIKAAGLKETP
ncbi:hypothetical protein [Pseudomonas sp. NBRC 111119]|uniref:hypothetical protein n=1 Tax=Pseudomonas sp. NBRC 111119 TaxID=1661034 RepID=UPI0007610F95|nr:hypothetical protein [Pseudomonas sp. NBRC 111119]